VSVKRLVSPRSQTGRESPNTVRPGPGEDAATRLSSVGGDIGQWQRYTFRKIRRRYITQRMAYKTTRLVSANNSEAFFGEASGSYHPR